jgi:putative transposase
VIVTTHFSWEGKMEKINKELHKRFQLPDNLWERIVPLIPAEKKKKLKGRPRMDDRKAMTAIFYVLRTGCQWNALPRTLGASSTVHDRFQEWQGAGLFEELWKAGLIEYDIKKKLNGSGRVWMER